MYFISWNEKEQLLEASIGGKVTLAEAKVFVDSCMHELAHYAGGPFHLVLDYSSASNLEDGVTESLNLVTRYAELRGAEKVTLVARDVLEAESLTGEHLQEVLEGRIEFIAA